MRPHAERVVFGDPVYFEVAITNATHEVAKARPEIVHGDRFRFEIRDPQTDLIVRRLDADGQQSPGAIEANATKRFHQWLFLPNLHRLNQPFWKPVRHGRTLYVCGVYALSPGVELRSAWQGVEVAPSEERQLEVLEPWIHAEVPGYEKGPTINEFGNIFLRSNLNRDQTAELSQAVTTGELADLLLLSVQLQDIYVQSRDERQTRDRALVEWLKRQPDVKRQALVKKVENIAESHNLTSTVKALEAIGDAR